MICPLLLLVLPQVWDVDASGGGDFLDLPEAVAAASDGDTIRVFPGDYSGFTTGTPGGSPGKSLNIVGDLSEAPVLLGEVEVNGSSSFTLAGFTVPFKATFRDVPGRVELDQLQMTKLDLIDCAGVVVSRSGINVGVPSFGSALFVQGGRASISDSNVTGQGGDDQFFGCASVDGGPAIVVEGSAEVLIVATDVYGGEAGIGNEQPCCDSEPGPAIEARDDSLVVLRGSSDDTIAKGFYLTGLSCNPPGDVEVEDNATLVWSGVALDPGEISVQPGATSIGVAPWQPYLVVRGSDVPGTNRRVLVYGPAGELGLLATAFLPAVFALPGFEGPVWFDLLSLLQLQPVLTQGPGSGVSKLVPVPVDPAVVGLTLTFQAVFPNLTGALDPAAMLLTNPGSLTIRF